MTLPDVADHGIHRFDLLKERLAEPDPIHDVLGAVERTLRSGGRVWVAGNIEIPPPGAALSALDLHDWYPRFGAFLRDHAAQAGQVPVPWDGPVSGYERLDLLVFSGWRTPG